MWVSVTSLRVTYWPHLFSLMNFCISVPSPMIWGVFLISGTVSGVFVCGNRLCRSLVGVQLSPSYIKSLGGTRRGFAASSFFSYRLLAHHVSGGSHPASHGTVSFPVRVVTGYEHELSSPYTWPLARPALLRDLLYLAPLGVAVAMCRNFILQTV